MKQSKTSLVQDLPEESSCLQATQIEAGSEVISSEYVQNTTLTNVQVTPVKTSDEITDAIRRHRCTNLIVYSKMKSNLSNSKTMYGYSSTNKARLTPCTPTSAQHLDINNHGDGFNSSKRYVTNCSNSNHDNGSTNKWCSPTNSNCLQKTASAKWNDVVSVSSVSGKRYGSGYSLTYNNQDKMATVIVHGNTDLKNQFEVNSKYCGNIASRNPRLNQSISDYPQGYSTDRFSTADVLTSRPFNQTSQGLPACIGNASFIRTSQFENHASTSRKLRLTRNELSSVTSNVTKGDRDVLPDLADNQFLKLSTKSANTDFATPPNHPFSLKPNSNDSDKAPSQMLNSPWDLSCVQFADSILGSELEQLYHLCHLQYPYGELKEKSLPNRFLENIESFKSQSSGPAISDATSQFTSRSSPSLLQEKVHLLCSLPTHTSQMQGFEVTKTSSQKTKLDGTVMETEANNDYDTVSEPDDVRPVTIITGPYNNVKRPILKSVKKTGLVEGCIKSNDRLHHNSNNTTGNEPIYAEADNTITPIFTRIMNCNANYMKASGRWNNYFRKRKSRLVRFNAYIQIHEFVPLEPVASLLEI